VLSSKRSVTAACALAGRDIAGDGATLGEALDGLRATYRLVTGGEPDFEASAALAEAWAETTLDYLRRLSCQDPLTGLASLAHVRTRVEELYRHAEQAGTDVQSTHALVIVAMTFPIRRGPAEHPFARALHLVRVAEVIRSAYSGETIGRLGVGSAVVVVRREANLGASVSLLREFLTALDLDSARIRVWIEGLPVSESQLGLLLEDLGRPT